MKSMLLLAVGGLVLVASGAEAKKKTEVADDTMQTLAKIVRDNARDSQGRRLYEPKTPPTDVGSWTPGDVWLRVWTNSDGGVCTENSDKKRQQKCVHDYEPVCNLYPDADTRWGQETWTDSVSAIKFKESSFNGMVPVLGAIIGAEYGSNNSVGYSATIGDISTHEVNFGQPYARTRAECRAARDRECLDKYEAASGSFDACKTKIETLRAKLPEEQWDNIFLVRKIVVTDHFIVNFDRNPHAKTDPNGPARGDNVNQPQSVFNADSGFLSKIVEGVTESFAAKGLFKSPAVENSGALGITQASHADDSAGGAAPAVADAADDGAIVAAAETSAAGDAAAAPGRHGGVDKIKCGSGFGIGVGHSLAALRFSRQACVVSDGVLAIRDPRVIGYVPAGLTRLDSSTAFEHRPGDRVLETTDIDLDKFSASPGVALTDEIAAILKDDL